MPTRVFAGFGRYRVESALGQGGMGSVSVATDVSSGRRLALKRLHPGADARQAARLEREFRTLASLRHPRIVQVFEYGVDELGPYYTMELLEGSDLAARAPLAWREVCTCLRDTASILGVLHARRLIHRDLSPRNLWLTTEGHLKLLDFGALAGFGPCDEVVGTPAFVAPEALAGRPLDQRTDLYALGALGYWLLVGSHAFNAQQLAQLHGLWRQSPRPLRARVPEVPEGLEQLLLSLLRLEPDERPARAADVVDRLNVLAGLAPEPEGVAVRGYLESGALVGREPQRQQLAAQLRAAERGRPGSWLIEARRGFGRSRLLAELALDARTRGAIVVSAAALPDARPYGLAIALLDGLLVALPDAAARACRPHANVLGALSGTLRKRLGAPPLPPEPADAAAERLRKQVAVSDVCLQLARQHTLALFVDDLQDADEESQALLSTLARAESGTRLLLVAARRPGTAPRPLASASAARRTPLAALAAAEVQQLLGSIFGEIPYLERHAARLHATTAGNPADCMQLISQLVSTGSARYADGGWSLTAEVPELVPASPLEAELASLAELPAFTRQLARVVSVAEHGALPREVLERVMTADAASLAAGCAQLEARGLLHDDRDGGLCILQPELRRHLCAELEPGQRLRVHRALALQLQAAGDLLSHARAGLHALRAGTPDEAARILLAVSRRLLTGEHELLRASARVLESALALLPDGGAQQDARLTLLCVLAVAGYQVDRRHAARWGDAALQTLWQALAFPLALRLRPVLGGKGALGIALGSAALRLAWRRSQLRLPELIRYWVAVLGYLMGPATLTLDSARLRRYATMLEPLLALGPDHGVACVHRFALGLVAATQDRLSEAHRLQAEAIERLERPGPVPGMAEANRRNLLVAALYNAAIRFSWACDARALETAERIAACGAGPLAAIQADHLRALHRAHRGELEAAAQALASMELGAIQLGTAWQAELLVPRHALRLAIWTRDLAACKRALRTLTLAVPDIPSLASCERRARACDAILRGRFEQAVALLEPDEAAAASGPIFMRVLLAEAYNALGRHADARRVCLDELGRFDDLDRSFVIVNLPLEIELARADAGLSQHAAAARRLDDLLARHAACGALITARLHGARAGVALQCGELEVAARHCEEMELRCRTLRVSGLREEAQGLRQALALARGETRSVAPGLPLLSDLEAILSSTSDRTEQARAGLELVVRQAGADSGFLLRVGETEPSSWCGVQPGEQAVAWARERLAALCDPDAQTVEVPVGSELDTSDAAGFDGIVHRITVLWPRERELPHPLALIVIAGGEAQPQRTDTTLLRLLGERLAQL